MIGKINRFVDAMMESQEKFQKVKLEIEQKDRTLGECIRRLEKQIKDLNESKLSSEAEKLCSDAKQKIGDVVIQALAEITKEEKGMEFIKKYEQSFNIAVFGKVKAGKSYLGNFIIGKMIHDLGIKTSYDKFPSPKVEVHDGGKKWVEDKMAEITKEGDDAFGVSTTEATSAIQLFRLGAMTWFDTPGIGSVNWENEMLAKDYVDNADLVVYACTTDAAGTQQDFKELKELYDKGKSVLILLTKSDTTEEDEDDNGDIISICVAKSDEDRRATEKYIRDELEKENMPSVKILTISAYLGMVALGEQDKERFDASHMGDFLDILVEITQTEGAQLKLKTPTERVNNAIVKIEGQLNSILQELSKYLVNIKEEQQKIPNNSKQLLPKIKRKCSTHIEVLVRQKAAVAEQNGESISSEELNDLLSQTIYQVISDVCEKSFSSSEQILSDYSKKIRVSGVPELKMKKEQLEYEVSRVKRVKREPKGLLEWGAYIFFDKSYYKTKTITEKKIHEIDIGMNTQAILDVALSQLNLLLEDKVQELITNISAAYIAQAEKYVQKANNYIHETQKDLEKIKCKP